MKAKGEKSPLSPIVILKSPKEHDETPYNARFGSVLVAPHKNQGEWKVQYSNSKAFWREQSRSRQVQWVEGTGGRKWRRFILSGRWPGVSSPVCLSASEQFELLLSSKEGVLELSYHLLRYRTERAGGLVGFEHCQPSNLKMGWDSLLHLILTEGAETFWWVLG